jgi:hypothetical protein
LVIIADDAGVDPKVTVEPRVYRLADPLTVNYEKV